MPVGLVLRAARELVAAGWCPLLSKRMEGDREVICLWNHPEATKHSLGDAIERACRGDLDLQISTEEALRCHTKGFVGLASTEGREATQAGVLALLDQAILKMRRAG